MFFFFSSRRRHTRWPRDWSSDVCSSDLAFDEVGDILNRTSAACGFRWNAEVRSKYVDAIELAKRQRKEKKRQMAIQLKKRPVLHEEIIQDVSNHPHIESLQLEENQLTMHKVIQ